MKYETIIIGSGIAGCSIGHFLQKYGQKILILDRSGIAGSGGSGSAGAFISPKIGKGSSLQNLTNEAYIFAKDFYIQNYPKYFHQTGVIRVPKDEIDSIKFKEYRDFNQSKYRDIKHDELKNLGIITEFNSFLFEEAGVCDAPLMCQEILSSIPHLQHTVKKINYINGEWNIDTFRAKNIVLATGYENNLVDMRYMGVKGTWGSRGDYYSNLDLSVSMHQRISISANINGIIKIGATHVKSKEPCIICDGKPLSPLEEKACLMIDSSDFKLKQTYCGMRAGSKDYFPLVGGVIDVEKMFKEYPKIKRGERVKEPMSKIDNLYILNGLGGRGFVFAPLMGKILAEHIINNNKIDKQINPDRLFLKWCRKLNS